MAGSVLNLASVGRLEGVENQDGRFISCIDYPDKNYNGKMSMFNSWTSSL
jgi:hypothetical protein